MLREYKVGPWRTEEVALTDLDKLRGYSRAFVAAIPAIAQRERHMYSDKGWEAWSELKNIEGESYVTNGFSGNGLIKFAKTDKGWTVIDNGGWGDFVWPPPNGWDDKLKTSGNQTQITPPQDPASTISYTVLVHPQSDSIISQIDKNQVQLPTGYQIETYFIETNGVKEKTRLLVARNANSSPPPKVKSFRASKN